MNWIESLLGGLIGLATSLSLIPFILNLSRHYGPANRPPEAHHTHSTPVPRLGGIALAAAIVNLTLVFGLLDEDFLFNNEHWLILSCSLVMFGLGLWDDLSALGARRKLFYQILIASVAYFFGIGIYHFRIPFTNHLLDLGLWAWPITVFWLVAMTNLINLIDGVDGLAGGIGLMLMLLLVYVSWNTGYAAVIAAGTAGALLGFLRYNFPPARIYLGDGGAYFLGFLIGCETIVTSQKGTIFAAMAAPLFVLALPIIDTSLAILRRGVRGLPVFRPDRKHLHHRLLAQGYSRRKVVLGLYGFTAFFLMLGFFSFYLHGQYFALFMGIGTMTVILAAGKFDFSREWFSIGRVLGNSLEARADIQYTICLSRCLASEGTRAHAIADIAEDAVFFARKLGFSTVRMRLEDEEKVWSLTTAAGEKPEMVELPRTCRADCCLQNSPEKSRGFRHSLGGHKYCFIELFVACQAVKGKDVCPVSESRLNTYSIQAELIAEAWSKAVADWKKRHQLPARFDARPPLPPALPANETKPILSGAKIIPLDE